jgi:hypothetical protein
VNRAQKFEPAKTVQSVSEAIDCLADDQLMRDLRPRVSSKRGDMDFGLWFRGHERIAYKLVPSILRESFGQNGRYVDEVSLIRHFKVLNPDAAPATSSDFDWLVTMQHYLAPTRLLDWTENLLVALYFSVRNPALDNKEDAAIWILNARRLNYYTSATTRSTEMGFPSDPDVIARSCLSRVRDRGEWHDVYSREILNRTVDRADYRHERIAQAIRTVQVNGAAVNDTKRQPLDVTAIGTSSGERVNPFDTKAWNKPEGLYARLRMPIAVMANRSNRRIRSQPGVFTLHGGKYVPNPEFYKTSEVYQSAIGMPVDLTDIDAGCGKMRILKWLRIPKSKREVFRTTLAQIGVTDAALFPELDYQSKYLLTRWTTFRQSASRR